MAVGPSLRKKDGHSSIHDAAIHEAMEIMNVYEECLNKGETQQASRVADVFIEHWETRTLAHAQTEEESLYPEVLEHHPEWEGTLIRLERDHTLMRRIVGQLKEKMVTHDPDKSMLQLMGALIVIDELHNEEEMDILPEH